MRIKLLNWIGRYLYRFPVRRDSKGSILIIVLWSLFFLSALALAVNAYIRPQIDLAARLKDRAVVYYLAEAGVKRAIVVLASDETPEYDNLKEFLPSVKTDFKEVGFGSGEFTYELVDEERKININKASYDVLKKFLETVGGITPLLADEISASILDWRDADEEVRENGAEADYYRTLNPPYPCKNKNFEILEELLLVKGMTREIFEKIKDSLTVYGTGSVNINTADKLVLQSLGMSGILTEKIINFRSGADLEVATKDDNVFLATQDIVNTLGAIEKLTSEETSQLTDMVASGLLCVGSNTFRGSSSGKNQGDSVIIDFVFSRNKAIEFWRER